MEGPDGGWGWMIVAASFLENVIVDGIIFTSGAAFQVSQTEMTVNCPETVLNSMLALLLQFRRKLDPCGVVVSVFIRYLEYRWFDPGKTNFSFP